MGNSFVHIAAKAPLPTSPRQAEGRGKGLLDPSKSRLAQPEPLDLSRLGLGQNLQELNIAGVFIGRDGGLDEVLDVLGQDFTGLGWIFQNDASPHDIAPSLVRHPHHGAFKDLGVFHDHPLHFLGRDIVSRRDNHVVGAVHIPEPAIGILFHDIAGDVPAIPDEDGLSVGIIQIAAPGRTAHRQPATIARRQRVIILVENTGAVTRNRTAGDSRV